MVGLMMIMSNYGPEFIPTKSTGKKNLEVRGLPATL